MGYPLYGVAPVWFQDGPADLPGVGSTRSTALRDRADRDPDVGDTVVGHAEDAGAAGRPRSREPGERGVPLDVVRDDHAARRERRPDLGELESEVPVGVHAVVHEQLDAA